MYRISVQKWVLIGHQKSGGSGIIKIRGTLGSQVFTDKDWLSVRVAQIKLAGLMKSAYPGCPRLMNRLMIQYLSFPLAGYSLPYKNQVFKKLAVSLNQNGGH